MASTKSTRNRIIEKAAELFNKKGYIGTSISDITNALEVTKGSIYGNFKDKNELALEAFRFNFDIMRQEMLKRIREEKAYTDKLLAYIAYYKDDSNRLFEYGGCPIMNAAIDADDTYVELHHEVQTALTEWTRGIEQIVALGMNYGEFKNVNAKEFAHNMISSIEGALMMAKTLNDSQILHNVLNRVNKDIQALRL